MTFKFVVKIKTFLLSVIKVEGKNSNYYLYNTLLFKTLGIFRACSVSWFKKKKLIKSSLNSACLLFLFT